MTYSYHDGLRQNGRDLYDATGRPTGFQGADWLDTATEKTPMPAPEPSRTGPKCTCAQVFDTGHDTACPRADWARGVRPTVGAAPDYRQPLTDFERRAGVVEPEPFPGDDSATVLRQIVGGGAGERWPAYAATDAVETLVTEHLRAGWMDRSDIERTGPFSLRVMHASYDGMSHAISYTDIDSGSTQIMTLSKGTTYAQTVDLILGVAGQVA